MLGHCREAETLPRIQQLLNGGRLVQGYFDIKGWLLPCLNNVSHHSKPLHFQFKSEDRGGASVFYRENCQRPWTTLKDNILTAIPKGEPSILLPPNVKNINISGLKTSIYRSQFQFTDKTSYRWWIKFITEIEQMAKSAKKVE